MADRFSNEMGSSLDMKHAYTEFQPNHFLNTFLNINLKFSNNCHFGTMNLANEFIQDVF